MAGRQIFSETEKICLQELIKKYKLHLSSTLSGNPYAKKSAWARVTEEFNSIELNTKRTGPQLKKCWDNMKTRRKSDLAHERRERMRTGSGPYPNFASTSHSETPSAVVEDALMESTDVQLAFALDSDAMELPENTTSPKVLEFRPIEVEIPLIQPQAQIASTNRTSSISGGKNFRAHVISQEFQLRAANYKRGQEREEELHRLQVAERVWLVKAAEERYHTARLERESAEEVLRYNRAKREGAEFLNNNKD